MPKSGIDAASDPAERLRQLHEVGVAAHRQQQRAFSLGSGRCHALPVNDVAVGDRTASPTSVTYKIGRTQSQMRHIDGAPMGTRGGVSAGRAGARQ